MYYLMTYGVNRHTSNKTRFMHAIVEDPLLALITLQRNNNHADYTMINVLEIPENKYLTQSIESIKFTLEFT